MGIEKHQGRSIFFTSPQQQEQAEAHLRRELQEFESVDGEKKRLHKFGRATTLAFFIGLRDPDSVGSPRQMAYDVMSRNYDIIEQQNPGFRRPDIVAELQNSNSFVRLLTKAKPADIPELSEYSGFDDTDDDIYDLDFRYFI